jgi:hypothetical protein
MASEQDRAELLSKMESERSRLLALLSSLDETSAEIAPEDAEGEAQWSAKQQASHLSEMETAYRGWVEAGMAEDNPDVTALRGDPVAIPLEQAHAHSVAEHVASLKDQRARTVKLIEGMKLDELDRTATHKWFGTLTLLQWLRSYYRHDRMHVDQMSGREPEYKPKFTTGAEPDQRRTRLT